MFPFLGFAAFRGRCGVFREICGVWKRRSGLREPSFSSYAEEEEEEEREILIGLSKEPRHARFVRRPRVRAEDRPASLAPGRRVSDPLSLLPDETQFLARSWKATQKRPDSDGVRSGAAPHDAQGTFFCMSENIRQHGSGSGYIVPTPRK